MKSVDEALDYILSVTWKGSRLGLERLTELLELLGNPQKSLKFVHIAGTNGKGSTSSMIASILQEAGYNVGLFTSPHLLSYQERIIFNHKPINDEDFIDVTEKLKEACEQMTDQPTVFERFTAMAFIYYALKKADYVVLEVGLGGRLDSTNVIDAPLVSVITNLGLEHTEILGNTIEEIALQKAGIIKTGSTCVCYDSEPAAVKVIEEVCKEKNVPFILADFSRIQPLASSLDGQSFSYKNYQNMSLALLGNNQLRNVSVVLEVIDVLKNKGVHISEEQIRAGLKNVHWPARFDLLSKEPLFILDGGHNPQCIESLKENLETYCPATKFTFIVGVLADKDYLSELKMILPFAAEFICLTPESDRALKNDLLAQTINELGVKAQSCATVEEAISLALATERPVCAFGSLYMAGDILLKYGPIVKKAQRRLLKNRLKNTSISKDTSQIICEKLIKNPVVQNARVIAGYKATDKEVDLSNFYCWAKENGKVIVYPKVVSATEMEMIRFVNEEVFIQGAFNILEPDTSKGSVLNPEQINVILCPCLGYDENHYRLGHGSGYYDRYLQKCPQAKRILIATTVQKLKKVIVDKYDQPVDQLITEEL